MNTICIYRKYKTLNRCNNNCISDKKYCFNHIDIQHYIFDLFDNIKSNTIKQTDLYIMFCKINNDKNLNEKIKYEYSLILINYCYNKNIEIFFNIIGGYNLSKHNTIYIYDIMYKTYSISKKVNITKLQKNIKERIYKKINIVSMLESENKEDIFTFENIEDIDNTILFELLDKNEKKYSFNGIELYYFINKVGKWNPYTKNEISYIDILRLNRLASIKSLDIWLLNDKYSWKTPENAYTEVSQLMEKYGFYTDVKWFMTLKHPVVLETIKSFKVLSKNIKNVNRFFCINKKILKEENNEYIYEFCKQIIKLFEKSNDNIILCCLFYKALSIHNIYFRNNIPNWVNDIVFSNIFHNTILRTGNVLYYVINN